MQQMADVSFQLVLQDCCGDRTVAKHQAIVDIYGGYMCAVQTLDRLRSKQ